MDRRLRFVFDTNVVISALLIEHGTPGQAFYKALDRGHMLLSDEVAQEINAVLSRKKFSRYITSEERERFLQGFIQAAQLVNVTEKIRACHDPKDNKFLELAVCGKASHLVTGDQDLLVLNPFRGIHILSPKAFLDFLDKGGEE